MEYKFNKWYVSGDTGREWSNRAYELCRVNTDYGSGNITGYTVGTILYLHYCKGLSPIQIREILNSSLMLQTIKSTIEGRIGSQAHLIFLDMLDTERDVLDTMFNVKTYKATADVI